MSSFYDFSEQIQFHKQKSYDLREQTQFTVLNRGYLFVSVASH